MVAMFLVENQTKMNIKNKGKNLLFWWNFFLWWVLFWWTWWFIHLVCQANGKWCFFNFFFFASFYSEYNTM